VADTKRGIVDRDVTGVENSVYWCDQPEHLLAREDACIKLCRC